MLCEDESLIGGPFAISEYVAGSTIQTRDQIEPLGQTTITAVASTLVATLAALHRVDHSSIGLGSFGRPDGYAARQLRRWSGQWRLVGAAHLDRLATRLIDRVRMCAYRHPVFDLIVGVPSAWTSPSLPTVGELADEYQAADGVGLADWDLNLALAYFKIAVIAAGIDHRRRSGSGAGPGFDTAGEFVQAYLELALQTLGTKAREPH